jgi:thioredoxin reductase (NADPH)
MRNKKIYDLLIIGAGPAGLGAGIQAAHLGMEHILLDREEPQSRLLLARKVENFPLIGDGGRSGPELYHSLIAQAKKNGVNIIAGAVSSIENDKGISIIVTEKKSYKTKAVILANGLLPKKLGREITSQGLEGKKLFYRWTDIPMRKRKEKVLVIGGGEVAFDQACSLAENGSEVTIAIRGKKDRVFDSLRREARKLGVSISYDTRVLRIAETKGGIIASMKVSGKIIERNYDYCLVAIGSRKGPSLISEKSNSGIFLAGDAAHLKIKQTAVAFGDGIKRTIEAYEYIRNNGK